MVILAAGLAAISGRTAVVERRADLIETRKECAVEIVMSTFPNWRK
jgi:hypothetical protein